MSREGKIAGLSAMKLGLVMSCTLLNVLIDRSAQRLSRSNMQPQLLFVVKRDWDKKVQDKHKVLKVSTNMMWQSSATGSRVPIGNVLIEAETEAKHFLPQRKKKQEKKVVYYSTSFRCFLTQLRRNLFVQHLATQFHKICLYCVTETCKWHALHNTSPE